jgi:hypothetical protein
MNAGLCPGKVKNSNMRNGGGKSVISRFAGALMRAVLVLLLILAPSAQLANAGQDARQITALLAFFAAVITFLEYNTSYPSLIEFRTAAPFNRLRFFSLAATLFVLTMIARDQVVSSTATQFFQAVGGLIGRSMDFPYSPVRLVVLMADADEAEGTIDLIRAFAGVAYLFSLLSLALFIVLIKTGLWPQRGHVFNVWVNLPTFDQTAGGDVVARLYRDGRANVVLGLLLPFLLPVFYRMMPGGVASITNVAPQLMIWMVATWAFLPTSMIMRGIAMARVAELILQKRRDNGRKLDPVFVPA